jgi:hypothetical protein
VRVRRSSVGVSCCGRGWWRGGTAAAAGVSASLSTDLADASTPPSVSLALARHWPWGSEVDAAKPFYLSPDPRGAKASGRRHGIDAPLLLVPFIVLVDVGHPPAVVWPFHVHVEAAGPGLAATAVGQNISFLHKSPHQVTTREWLGIFPVELGHGALKLKATIHEHLGRPAFTRSEAGARQAESSTVTVAGDFSQAPSVSTLPINVQSSMVESVADQSAISFDINQLYKIISDATVSAKTKLGQIRSSKSAISIDDMFEMQMLMNQLSQLSELSTATIDAASTAIKNMTRNIK